MVFLCVFFAVPADISHAVDRTKRVLVLNSYHEGFPWTENIVEGINSVLGPEFRRIRVDFEYMDAKRHSTGDYFERLYDLYACKYRESSYDLILCSDETAFRFLRERRQELFPDTPVVFCGVNHLDGEPLGKGELITGVLEGFDVRATLSAMIRLHPERRKIYVVNDETPTGRSVAKEMAEIRPDFPGLEFIPLSGLTMEEMKTAVGRLQEDSLVLFLTFFRDAGGNSFSFDESIESVSSGSAVPVYGVWRFYLGHGIVGGALTSGYSQGRGAALIARRILEGESPAAIPVIRERSSRFAFDMAQLERFGIDRARLPVNSMIINETHPDRKRLLVLHSYDPQMAWVRSIEAGIQAVLGGRDNLEVYHDYMDLKRHPGPEFAQRIRALLREKYRGQMFDAVLVSDDGAYDFLSAYGERLFPGTPIVFCGVNGRDPSDFEEFPLVTGLVSEIDVRPTLDLALKLHPEARRVVVVNDGTDLGRAVRQKVLAAEVRYRGRAKFVFLEDMSMSQVRERVSRLGDDSILLFLAFNQDRAGKVFSHERSIRLIAERARVPIYGIWDFYLGNGLLGGRMTSGFSQGKAAAGMVRRILDGEPVSGIPVVSRSPDRFMFDYVQMKRFGVPPGDLPEGSVILNRPETFYEQNRLLVWATLFVVLTLAGAVVIMAGNIRRRKKVEAELRYFATTDDMTGVLNRRTGLLLLGQQMALADRQGKKFCVCFADLNNLKCVNDNCGHDKGDAVILRLCTLLGNHIRNSDVLCRFGGDEFLVILPGCSLSEAEKMWERVMESVRRHNAGAEMSCDRVDVSHGFAEYDPGHPVDLDALIRTADLAMYREKGKNR